MITQPRALSQWKVVEGTSGRSQQSGIQGVINAELTLVKWDSQTTIIAHRDYMKGLRTQFNLLVPTIHYRPPIL